MSGTRKKPSARFATIRRADVPTGRHGKHNSIVAAILGDLSTLADGQALKIPLSDLPDTKINIRSALNRASRKARLNVATAADEKFLYIWNVLT